MIIACSFDDYVTLLIEEAKQKNSVNLLHEAIRELLVTLPTTKYMRGILFLLLGMSTMLAIESVWLYRYQLN